MRCSKKKKEILKSQLKCWTMRTLGVLTYQYSVTVNDSVEPVSNGEDCAFFKFVPDSLLDEDVSSERTGNTTPQQRKKLCFNTPLGREFT